MDPFSPSNRWQCSGMDPRPAAEDDEVEGEDASSPAKSRG